MENRNYYTLTLSLLGAVKLILNSFGINLISDQMANDLANAIATILTVVGVIMTHLKNQPKMPFKSYVSRLFKKKAPTAITPNVSNSATPVATVNKTVQTTFQAETAQTNSPVSEVSAAEQKDEPEPGAPAATITGVQKQ